ncbi:MAG: hypothetical protein DRI56_12980, partial [Chloroflexota bacterium]
MNSLPILKWGLKLMGVVLWGISSVFVSGVSFFMLLNFAPNSLIPSFVENSLNYSLYKALPNRGSVLGHFVISRDARGAILQEYLKARNSPLLNHADDFIRAADQYRLPWTLLPAIAGKESGFGKSIPKNSYNPFGWGVYTGQQTGVNFSSWKEAIFSVAKGLRENYFDKGLDTP